MGGEPHSPFPPQCSPESSSSADGSAGAGAPIRFLVFMHKAIRAELDELKRLAADAVAGGVRRRGFVVVELRRRLEFFRSVYSYHCAAEDEVVFLALDARVENIACTYSLEHNRIDCTLDSLFSCLNRKPEHEGDAFMQLQELMFLIGALQESICQHMIKEEEQVFPLLLSKFSDEEQASLVWQFICSVPVILMEDLFPWMTCFLSLDEQTELKLLIRKIVPREKSLQVVVVSWLDKSIQQLPGGSVKYDMSSECPGEPSVSFGTSIQQKQESHVDVKDVLCSGLLVWHAAIRFELKEITDKLYGIRLKKLSNLPSVILQINFLADVLMFYCNALEKNFYPILEEIFVLQPSQSYKTLSHINEVERLHQVLFDANEISLENPMFLEMLCSEVEALVLAASKHFSFQEVEVFPLISKNCDLETQQKLVFRSLRMLPLGLLKCVLTWLSSHLPKDNLRSILYGIKKSGFLEASFASLLHEWIRIGYSGKTTMQDLQEMFNGRVSYLSEHIREGKDPSKNSKHLNMKHCSVNSSRSSLSNSLSRRFHLTKKHGTLYSSGINLFMFTRSSKWARPSSECPADAVPANILEAKPMDHIYYFHKALKKDLESLALDTTKLTENLGLLMDFIGRFRRLQSLYELHSETEDEIAFPALEAKKMAKNLTDSYYIDHKLEAECFNKVSAILDELSVLYHIVSGAAATEPGDPALMKYHELCVKLQDSCISLKTVLNDHIYREEIELWPLFRDHFSIEEQEKIIGLMLGRTRVDILQEMIVWLMASLTSEELHAVMTLWRKATKYTMFGEWLEEWLGDTNSYAFSNKQEPVSPSPAKVSLEMVAKSRPRGRVEKFDDDYVKLHEDSKPKNIVKSMEGRDLEGHRQKSCVSLRLLNAKEEKRRSEAKPDDVDIECNQPSQIQNVQHLKNVLSMHQVELEAAIRKVSQDSSLDLQEKSRIIQNLMTSRWIAAQPPPNSETSEPGKLPGQFPSYRDTGCSVFGCKHYKQNCKLVAECCNKLFTCRRCHDEVVDHVMDRKSTTQMMCMKCLEVQPVKPTCSTPSCDGYSMARYYCRICRLFDDEREIYHCPYCNICRVGKGKGIGYFHCMKCNACMWRSISVHICREKCLEDKCPICHEDMFTSSTPIKGLDCGHMMHSTCFEEYTRMHYTCPVCSKSLGNMHVYFTMLDALLAEEKIPDEFSGQTRVILCNDCQKKGTAPFHWLYHKCPFCGSYNTRVF